MEAAGYAANPWVNAGDRADKDGNLQLRQSRLLKVRQEERSRAQAHCQARHKRAEAHKQARKAERRMTEQREHDDHLHEMQALHAAALRQAHQAQEKALMARRAAEKAEVAAEATAATRHADAKQRFADAVSKARTERQQMHEGASSRLQHMARTREAEKQRAAAQAKAARASRRRSLSIDAQRCVNNLSEPARNVPMISAAGAHAKGSVNQLHRKKAAERGRAALRRARQERRAAELSRSLQRAERDNQLHRAQHDTAMDASPVASQVPQDQENMQHEAAASMHQPASCKAQLTAGGTAAAAKPGMSCQQAKQAATPQRAPVEVIAQTQWQLQSVRPESHDFLRNSAGRLQRITAAVSKAAHGKGPVPFGASCLRTAHTGGRGLLSGHNNPDERLAFAFQQPQKVRLC
ncbi:g7270 [Coccomyxa viridis]|uniref:G7270 protein n=1 Tax=Coccomyxa viridis TaxID=1274662 RepID=A0ABP1G1G6_9CHLO